MNDKCLPIKVRHQYLKRLQVVVGPLSAIHPFSHSLALTSPGHWATLENYRSGFTGDIISLPVLWAANIRRPGISNLHRHRRLGVQYTPGSTEASVLREDNHVRPVLDSNQGPLDLQFNALQLDQRGPI